MVDVTTVLPVEPDAPAEPATGAHFDRKKLIRTVVSLVLIAAIFWFVLPKVANFSDVWAEIKAMTPLELIILGVFAFWNLVTYWIIQVVATPGMTIGQAFVVTEASTAVANTIPAGSAIAIGVQFSMMTSWGFSKSRTTVSLVIQGIWNNFVKLGMPVMALALLAFEGQANGPRVVSGIIGIAALITAIVIFTLILRSPEFARRFGDGVGRLMNKPRRLFHKEPAVGWGDATTKFRDRVIGIVRARWITLTVTSLVGHGSLFLVLIIALRDIGVSQNEVSWIQALAVFAFVRLLTAIPLTPGGLGIVEFGLIAGLTKAGGDHEQVVAAVLVYRLLTYVAPIPLGVASYIFWRRNKSWHNSAPPLDPKFTAASASASA